MPDCIPHAEAVGIVERLRAAHDREFGRQIASCETCTGFKLLAAYLAQPAGEGEMGTTLPNDAYMEQLEAHRDDGSTITSSQRFQLVWWEHEKQWRKKWAEAVDLCGARAIRIGELEASPTPPAGEGQFVSAWAATVILTAFQNYGRHFHWCDYLKPISEDGIALPCTCGFDAELSKLWSLRQAAREATLETSPTPPAEAQPVATEAPKMLATFVAESASTRYDIVDTAPSLALAGIREAVSALKSYEGMVSMVEVDRLLADAEKVR